MSIVINTEKITNENLLFEICEWIKTTDEYKDIPVTEPHSIFYHTSPLTFAKLILKWQQQKLNNQQ